MNGVTGVDSVEAANAKIYLMGYARASVKLWGVLVDWEKSLTNICPDWASYRGMTTRRLLRLDKNPVTRQVGIRSSWL